MSASEHVYNDSVDVQPNSDYNHKKSDYANEFTMLAHVFLEKLKVPKQDIEKNAHALFEATVSKMDLVTRDELERQQILLKQSQAELIQLKEKITQLENRINQQNT